MNDPTPGLASETGSETPKDAITELCEILKECGAKVRFWVCPKGCNGRVTWTKDDAKCEVCGFKRSDMKPTEEQINAIQFDPADPNKSFRQIQELMTRKPDEPPTAPATPALSQIRERFENILYAKTWDIYQKAQDYELICERLLSIADMLYAENAKLKKGLVEVVDYCENEMQPWENEGIPAYEPSIVDLHNIALSALRSIAQMEEGKA